MSLRRARLFISAVTPNVQGAAWSEVVTRLTSVPSCGVDTATTSPTTCVKPWTFGVTALMKSLARRRLL